MEVPGPRRREKSVTPPEGISDVDQTKRDEQRLAELGYKQELSRDLERVHQLRDLVHDHLGPRGMLHDVRVRLAERRPDRISIGWPVLCFFVLMVGFSMAELTSTYPTAGGPYWWAHDLGGKGWSWMTGWFNIVGLLGIVASVAYGAAIFLNSSCSGSTGLNVFGINFGDTATSSARRSCSS